MSEQLQETTQDQDKESQARTDQIAEWEIALGFRTRVVPKQVLDILAADRVDAPTRIRLSRVNPFRRSEIAKAVQRRFHRDLQDKDILSNAQVLKLVEDRGEWSAVKQREMEDLQEATTREMGKLWADGLTPDTTSFADGILKAHARFHEIVKDMEPERRALLLEKFDLWVSWTPRLKGDARYPEGYDAGAEMAALYDFSPPAAAIDAITEIEEFKEKQERLVKLTEDRVKLAELQLKHGRIFSDTAESRRDHTEQMAQLYFTCDRIDVEGRPIGPLTPEFDALWKWPDGAIQWLLTESFFFHNNIPDAAREYLGAFGFFTEALASTASGKSDGSLEAPSSRTDGGPATATPSASSDSPEATT